ncbi:GLPGLI family protein [Flavobacterium zepuense]|nr:GLPGLI family protein [Flavobacterium zepuense]
MKTFIALLLALPLLCFAQKQPKAIKVTYQKSYLGRVTDADNPVVIFSDINKTMITSTAILAKKAILPAEQTVVSHSDESYIQLAELGTGKFISTKDSTSIKKQQLELLPDTKTILGYTCHKAKTVINSNTIEIWYTNDLGIKGAPSVLGIGLGLVLETVRNNNFVVTATKVEKLKDGKTHYTIPSGIKITDALSYRDQLWKSRFTTISVFKDEVINFSGESASNDSVVRFANGTVILRKINFPEIKPGNQVFVDLTEQSNGDAYDRTGSVFIIPQGEKQSFLDGLKNGVNKLPLYDNGNGKKYQGIAKVTGYMPLLELMRFFTPFGVKQYNYLQLKDKTWQEAVPYRQDISELAPSFSNKEVWVGVFIGNYDKGGHKISMNLTIHKDEVQYNKDTTVLPLFNTVNVMEMAGQEYGMLFSSPKGLEVHFTLQKDLKNARLRYITTGHGGWENGDEYLPKKNTITLDGKTAFAFVPWRQDCGTYRLYNPASGNFENGLSSSDYSRSNWCPGTVTNPEYIDLGDLKAGGHIITITIPMGAPEGTNFSAWNISGVLLGRE